MIKQRFPLAKGKAHKKTPSDGRKDLDATNKLGRFFLGRVNVKMSSYWQTQIQRQRQTQRQWQKQAQRHTQRFWMLMVSAPVSSGRAQSRPPLLVSGRPDPPLASESPPPPSSLSLSLSLGEAAVVCHRLAKQQPAAVHLVSNCLADKPILSTVVAAFAFILYLQN